MTITVTGHVLPGKPDPNTTATFTNDAWAEKYASAILATGDYSQVQIIDAHGEPWVMARVEAL